MNYKQILKLILLNLLFSQSFSLSVEYSNARFNEWTWLTAHNANNNPSDSGVISGVANQIFGIDTQLKYGVRGFMFDIAWKSCSFLEKLFQTCKCQGVCMCHGECDSNMFKDGFNQKPYSYALKKIVDFLKNNPNDIITIFLENYVKDFGTMKNIYDSIDGLGELIFNPNDLEWEVIEKGWPKIGDMIAKNKRLLIVDDEKRALHADYIKGVIRSRDFFIQNHYEWFQDRYEFTVDARRNLRRNVTMPRCFSLHKILGEPMWSENNPLDLNSKEHLDQPLNKKKLFLFNHFIGITIVSQQLDPYKVTNKIEFIVKRINEKCNKATGNMKPNYIALDFIDKATFQMIDQEFNAKKRLNNTSESINTEKLLF